MERKNWVIIYNIIRKFSANRNTGDGCYVCRHAQLSEWWMMRNVKQYNIPVTIFYPCSKFSSINLKLRPGITRIQIRSTGSHNVSKILVTMLQDTLNVLTSEGTPATKQRSDINASKAFRCPVQWFGQGSIENTNAALYCKTWPCARKSLPYRIAVSADISYDLEALQVGHVTKEIRCSCSLGLRTTLWPPDHSVIIILYPII